MEGGGSRSGIDHVTTPAITSDMPVCFYCTVMPNEIVSCKNTGEKHHVLDEGGRAEGTDRYDFVHSLMRSICTFFINTLASNKGYVTGRSLR